MFCIELKFGIYLYRFIPKKNENCLSQGLWNHFWSWNWKKSLKKLGIFRNNAYLCIDKSRPLPIRTAYPAGHFLYIDMRYTKQAMTLAQQIQTLQGRGLMIADTNKAEQALVRRGVWHWWTRAYGSLSWVQGDRQSGIPPRIVCAACCSLGVREVLLVSVPQTLVQWLLPMESLHLNQWYQCFLLLPFQ